MPHEPDFATHAETVALFRYGLIADLRDVRPGDRTLHTRLEEKAAREYDIPGTTRRHVAVGTLRDWLYAYRRGGFDAPQAAAPARRRPGARPAPTRRRIVASRARRHSPAGPPPPAVWRCRPSTSMRLFLFEEKRKVQKDRTVSLRGVVYEVDASLVGETVTLRYDPARATRGITVVFRDRVVDVAKPVDAYANCFVRRDHGTKNLRATTPASAPPAGLALRRLDEDF